MLKLIFLKISMLLILFLYTGCDVEDSQQPVYINSSLIGKGPSTGNDKMLQQNIIISDSGSWHQLINMMDYVSGNFTETEIDFSQYLVIAAIDSARPSSGYEIDIKNIIEYPENILVNIENILPGKIVLGVETQPYHIVKIPRKSKEIIFN